MEEFYMKFKHNIRVAGENIEVGVYFNNMETQALSKVDVIIPSISTGGYKLEIVTQFSDLNQSPLKSFRSNIFNKILTALFKFLCWQSI